MNFYNLYSLLYDFLLLGYTLLKLYRVMCYTKFVIDQIIYLNPYSWPMSAFVRLTAPYFLVWNRFIPIKPTRKFGIYFSGVIAIEVLNLAIKLYGRFMLIMPTPYQLFLTK